MQSQIRDGTVGESKAIDTAADAAWPLTKPLAQSALWLSCLALVALAGYWMASTYPDTVAKGLGLQPWQDLSSAWKLGLGLAGVAAILTFGMTIARLYSSWSSSERIAILLVSIVFIFVPIGFGINTFPVDLQNGVIRVLLTVLFTALPASFYVLFIATKGKTLWNEFETFIDWLEPRQDAETAEVYRTKFEAIYGPTNQTGAGAVTLGDNSFPVIVATLITGLSWIGFFSYSNFDVTMLKDFGAAAQIKIATASPILFGFLGAYLFSLQMLLRRYLQSDLKSVAYNVISQRILGTFILAFVLSTLPLASGSPVPGWSLGQLLAFIVGVLPDVAWQTIRHFAQTALAFLNIPSFEEKHPLSALDGMTIWTQARLLEEDIENVQNLVTSNVIDLMLRTNFKPNRLIDWIDQGVLCLHLDETARDQLKQKGILTATDLIYATDPDLVRTYGVAMKAVDDDPNMYSVKAFRLRRAFMAKDLDEDVRRAVEEEKSGPPTPARPDSAGIGQTSPA